MTTLAGKMFAPTVARLNAVEPDDPDNWQDESEDYSDLEEERADFEDVPVVD